MTLQSGLLAGLLLTLSACALPPELATLKTKLAETTSPSPLNEFARISGLSAEQRRRELADLENGRLNDSRRFQLAALLERDDSLESMERGLKALSAMSEQDARSQALIDLMKRSFKARIEQKQLAARSAELQDKLEQIKALEKSLQQRNAPLKTP